MKSSTRVPCQIFVGILWACSVWSTRAAEDKPGRASVLGPGLIDRGNYTLGHTRVFYVTEANKRETMLVLVPESKLAQVDPRRQKIKPGEADWSSQQFASVPADALVSLAQVHVAGQRTNPLGTGLIEDPETTSLVWVGQKEIHGESTGLKLSCVTPMGPLRSGIPSSPIPIRRRWNVMSR